MAEENEISIAPRPQRPKQSISVPFLWEEKPGTPKIEWALSKPSPWVVPPSPARLIVSDPFLWEEKPGKPLHQSQESKYQALNERLSDDASSYCKDWYSLSETDGHGRNASIDASAVELFYPLLPPPPDAGLGFLFPLLSPPSASFLDKVCRQDRAIPNADDVSSIKGWRQDCGITARRTLTLEELIMLSHKLSYKRKPDSIKKKKFSMVIRFSTFPALIS